VKIAEYLGALRKRRGHRTVIDLGHFARTLGEEITAEALRKYERDRTPNRESRVVLAKILQMTDKEKLKLESLCLAADTNVRAEESQVPLDAFVADAHTRPLIVTRLVGLVEAIMELEPDERDTLRRQFEEVLREPRP